MAAAETSTVFLETSLDTRLVVSFPAHTTTVADLKRQVSADHAACFPRTGPIAVASLQIQLDGSWFQLTDSMVVEAAFEWVKGPRRLLVEAHELRRHPPACKDAKCGTADAEPNAGHSGNGISDTPQLKNEHDKVVEHALCHHEDGITIPSESSDIDLAIGNSGTGTPLANQEDKPQECLEHVSHQLEDGIAMSEHSDLATGDSDTSLTNQENKLQGCDEHASVQFEDGITIPQESSHFDSATGTNNSPLPNQEDKLQGCAKHASGHLEDGTTMPQESSDFDLAAGGSDTLPMDRQDKFHDGEEHASGHSEGRTTMPQESSDLGVAVDKENDRAGDQQKGITMEPRGKKRFREEDEADRSTIVNCDGNLSPFASPEPKFVSEKKSSMTEQVKLDSAPLLYNLEGSSHGLSEKPSGGQKEQWTSGVYSEGSINNGPAIPPCAESMGKDKSLGKEVITQSSDKEEPQIAGCTGKSSCKGTNVPHYVESMNEGNKRPASNGHLLDKGKNEEAMSIVTKEHEPCFRIRHHRVAVRKVAISRAMKVYPFSPPVIKVGDYFEESGSRTSFSSSFEFEEVEEPVLI